MFTCQIVQIQNGFICQFPQSEQQAPQVHYCATMQDVADYLLSLGGNTPGNVTNIRGN